jgi:iron complex outermembrane recepter protein
MKSRQIARRSTLALAIAAAGLPVQASAESMLEEVIVTATRRAVSIQDVPYNISAISGEMLERQQIIDQVDLMRAMTGVSVVDRGYRNSGVANTIVIRGLNVDSSANGDFALNAVPSVGTYVNDTPIFANFLLKDIERVEVLRGPQGTLYGSGSLGGTVRYIMRAPDPEAFSLKVDGGLSVTEGSDGHNWSSDVAMNLPLSSNAALRVSGGTLRNDGVVDYSNVYVLDSEGLPAAPSGVLDNAFETRKVEDADDVEIDYVRAALLFEPSDDWRFLLSWQHQEDDIGARRHPTEGLDGFGNAYGDLENGSVQLEPSSREADLGALEITVDLGFATLTSSSSYYDHSGDSESENTGFYAQNGWLAAYYYNYPRPMASAERSYRDEAFVQELRLVSQGDGPLDYLVGAFYMDQDRQATQASYLRGFERWATAAGFGDLISDDESDFAYVGDESYEEMALFGELTWHFNERLSATIGARYFDNDFQIDGDMLVGIWEPGIFRFSDQSSYGDSESDVLYKANLSYELNDQAMIYATISEGYRRGGANVAPQVGFFAENPEWQTYDSDTVTNYELGIKGSTNTLRYSVAAFFVDWQDVQLNTATPNWGFFAAQNGDEAETKGLELELEGQLGERLSYNLGYTYLDAELTSDLVRPDNGALIAPDGTRLPGSADHTFSAALQYEQQFQGNLRWRSNIGVYYQDETENVINQSARFKQTLDDFSIINASSSLEGDVWTATLWVRNLTDEAGVTGVYKEEYMGTDPAQNYYGNGAKQLYSQPRTIGISIGYRYQ